MKRKIIAAMLIGVGVSASAQRVTNNHDDAKMNQIMVQETGAGTLTPDLYYWLLHNKYKKKANAENKMSFRTIAGLSAYQQIDDAEKLDSAMVKRAEIESLNMADRQIDLAWLAEGRKIEEKLAGFERNINRIMTVGGRREHEQLWREYYNKFATAIRAVRQAYLPNSQRKKEYLRIYTDIVKANDSLIKFLVQLNGQGLVAEYLSARYDRVDRRGAIAQAAKNRWRGVSWGVLPSSNISGGLNPFIPVDRIEWDGEWVIIDGLRYPKEQFIKDKDKILKEHLSVKQNIKKE